MNPARGVIDGLGFGPAYHDLWWRVAARRKPLITDWNRRHGAIFIHVPKAAGLSVYRAFAMERPPDTHAPAHAWRRADPAFFAGAYRFAVIRNPWDRLVSAFHYLKQDSAFPQDRLWAARRLAGCDDFAAFLAALHRPWFRNQILGWRHFLPQARFLSGEAVDLVPFEALDEGLEAVAKRIGAPYRPAHENRSHRRDYRSYFDDAGAALVARIYAEDLALTGAAFDPPI